MLWQFRRSLLLACVLGLCAAWIPSGAVLRAQDDNPFDDPEDATELDEHIDKVEPEVLGGAAERPPVPRRDSPLVLAIRESNPNSPEDLVRAVEALLSFDEVDEAKMYLTKLIAAKPKPQALVELHDTFGAALFLRLAREARLAPEAGQLSDAVLAAAGKHKVDERRLAALIEQLSDRSSITQQSAVLKLRDAGTAAIGPMTAVLADASRAAEHAAVRNALVALEFASVDPLIGALETDDVALKTQVIEVLGRLRQSRAVPYLLAPLADDKADPGVRQAAANAVREIVGASPSRSEARTYLARKARSYYNGMPPGRVNHENTVQMWLWDAKTHRAVARRFQTDEAATIAAARLSADLATVAPDDAEVRQLYLAANLEKAKLVGGLGRPLDKETDPVVAAALDAGPAVLEKLLEAAMKEDRVAGAIAAAELLGRAGDESLLHGPEGRERPLTLALRHGDRRVRFAAAGAVMNIDPKSPYPGSSRLTEALGYLAGTRSWQRVLVAYPRPEHAQTLAGLLTQIGYEPETVTTGKDAVRRAVAGPDFQFVLVSDAIDYPRVNEVVQQLRRDPRTAGLPVGVLSREGNLDRAKMRADLDPLTLAFPRPHDAKSVAQDAVRLTALAARHAVSPAERRRQAATALEWLAQLAEDPAAYGFYDVRRQQTAAETALFDRALSASAARVLGAVGSPEAQTALVDFASLPTTPLAARQAAVKAFGAAVERRRLLLTTDQILRQFDRYRLSADQDEQTRAVLAGILDVIESKTDQSAPQE